MYFAVGTYPRHYSAIIAPIARKMQQYSGRNFAEKMVKETLAFDQTAKSA